MNVPNANRTVGGGSAPGAPRPSRTGKAWLTRNRLYYIVKPWLPYRVRIVARRILVSRQLQQAQGVWPIMAGTERVPNGWPGWPDGKKFAFVLTHDVEGASGVTRCSELARIEREYGFRSAFNFIPEGTYETPPKLREELVSGGFEVGIHDLKHNGRLFESRTTFGRLAVRINHYLREWKAVGFRSGFMLRESEWLHDLNIEYDLSTFDTDPFEPQPEGGHTIFPFWVPLRGSDAPADGADQGGEGYVELPYTLPQDSTLYVLLKEQTPEIWLRKLDWIAENGGMALVNIHPDYLRFENAPAEFGTYSFDLIRQLLGYVRTRYAGQFWNPRPRDLARWYRGAILPEAMPRESGGAAASMAGGHKILRNKKAAVVLYSFYPADPRPRRAAEALIDAGMSVDLFCLRENDEEPAEENVNGVNVFRLPVKKKRGTKLDYLWQYGSFLLRTFWCLARRGIGEGYDLVHVHNMPDVLVFSALVPKLRHAGVMLDLHDPMPELMMSIFKLRRAHPLVKMLAMLERQSIAFSHIAFTPNIAFQKLFASRSCPPDKIRIVMNSPEEEIFSVRDAAAAPRPAGEFRLMHHGSIVHRHGVDLLVEAVAQVRGLAPNVRLDIYGSRTPFLDEILELSRRLGVDDIVHYHGPKTQAEIARAILECDVGVVPNRFSAFTNINFPTRLFEYLAMRRPVIAPATQGILDYFGEDEIITFEPDNVSDLAGKILWVEKHRAEVPGLVERGANVYRRHLWSGERERFLDDVSGMLRELHGA